jgi:hypothetical protein
MTFKTFKVGDKVRRTGDSFPECEIYRGKCYTVSRLTRSDSIYLEEVDEREGSWSCNKFELVNPVFTPEAGDIIVTNNGNKYECVSPNNYRGSTGNPVCGHNVTGTGHQSWDVDGQCGCSDYNINHIIPKPKALPEPAVYSVRQVADAIHAVTGTPPQPEYEERIVLLNKHLAKVNDPDWKKYQELKEKFKDA